MTPLDAGAIAVLLRVVLMRRADPWLRLTAGATLAQHGVALIYATAGRYTALARFSTSRGGTGAGKAASEAAK